MRRRRKSDLNHLIDMLFELTGFVWQIGAAVTATLLFLSYMAYGWAENLNTIGERTAALSAVIANVGWAVYLLPLILTILAVLFGVKTFDTYIKERF